MLVVAGRSTVGKGKQARQVVLCDMITITVGEFLAIPIDMELRQNTPWGHGSHVMGKASKCKYKHTVNSKNAIATYN